jgi:hypothetical protein
VCSLKIALYLKELSGAVEIKGSDGYSNPRRQQGGMGLSNQTN